MILIKTTELNSVKPFLFCISFFIFFCFVFNRELNVLLLGRSFTFYLLYFKVKVYNKCLIVKTAFCLIITVLSWLLVTENKHLSRDPQLSNLQHAVGYSKDGDFQIKRIHGFYNSKEEYSVEQFMQFRFSKLSFQRDTLR